MTLLLNKQNLSPLEKGVWELLGIDEIEKNTPVNPPLIGGKDPTPLYKGEADTSFPEF